MTVTIKATGLVREFRQRPGRDARLVERLVGRSKVVRAVDGIDLEIGTGEMVGYLGTNGAGKSTTIKLLSGLLSPTRGEVQVLGMDPWRDRRACAYHIGVVFGQRSQLSYDTPLIDSFTLIRDLYGIPRLAYNRRIAELVALLDVESILDRPVRVLSLGQRMRGDLIAALLPRPRVLFLDEPTIGLDIIAKQAVYGFLEYLRDTEEVTTILTSHDMRDIERLCHRLIVIDAGRKVFDGGIDDLKLQLDTTATVIAELDARNSTTLCRDVAALEGVTTAEMMATAEGHRLTIRYDSANLPVADLVGVVLASGRVTDLRLRDATLDDVITSLYGRLGRSSERKSYDPARGADVASA